MLLEKPVEVTVERARPCVAAMDSRGDFASAWSSSTGTGQPGPTRDLLGADALGRLVSGSASIRWWRPPEYFAEGGRGTKHRDGGGVLLTQAIHGLDLFQSLTGPDTRVAAMAATSPLRASTPRTSLRLPWPSPTAPSARSTRPPSRFQAFPERIELACAGATAILQAESMEVHWKDGRAFRHEGGAAGGGGADPMAFSRQDHKTLIGDFLDAIDEGRDPTVSGREATRVQVLIEAILQSAVEGRAVEVPAS